MTPAPFKILYAEDDIDDQFFLSESLRSNGVEADIVYVPNGDEAINYLEKEEELPTLIVLDVNMPSKDGKSTLKYLKNHKRLSRIPVIMLSTSENQIDKQFCTQLGAAFYFKKPNSFMGYNEIVKKFLSFVPVYN